MDLEGETIAAIQSPATPRSLENEQGYSDDISSGQLAWHIGSYSPAAYRGRLVDLLEDARRPSSRLPI